MKTTVCLMFVMALTACANQIQPARRAWTVPTGVKTVSVNGYDMAYVERGTGIPVIFVHGGGVDYRYFSAQMEPVSERYRSISVSLRHYYPEPWRGEGEFNLNQHVQDLVAFIRILGVGPVHLVGHSRGATVALYVAKASPDLVRTLTFAEGGTSMPAFDSNSPVARDPRTDWRSVLKEKLRANDVEGAIELFVTRVSGPGTWTTMPEPTKQTFRDNAWTLSAMFDDQLSWAPLTCEDARRLETPVLLLAGERSPPIFRAVLDNVEKCLRRVVRRTVMNSSHAIPRMNPAGFTAEVVTFISQH